MLVGWTSTLWLLLRSQQRQRLAWQWWYEQQWQQQQQRADAIRDGLLQQTFAFRRYLESAPLVHPQDSTTQTEQWLERFQQFYRTLENLSNELSPPFVEDSLPLALQFAIKELQAAYPHLTVALNLPPTCVSTSLAPASPDNAIMLSIVVELIQVLVSNQTYPQHLQLQLEQQNDAQTLTLHLDGIAPEKLKNIVKMAEVNYLREIFQSLVAGKLDIKLDPTALICQLHCHTPLIKEQ
jgi:hypothetical protein